ncbi:zinc finger CCCH domain-containing protein 3 [Cyrtonyx montezumae]|uniref:zinc finger CCCH domain-containing protein 3 n=1 Tax=Cyrtonyx montezumae TaxID=9017 RepID=UPI0032DACC0B
MEERERLRREIRLLQGLIDNHRNTHGDVPRPLSSAPRMWSNPTQPPFNRRGAFSARYPQLQPPRDFQPRRAHSWRKKYSLVNQPPGPACDVGSGTSSRAFGSSEESQAAVPSSAASPERQVDLTTDGNIVVGIQVTQRTGLVGTEGFIDASAYCEVSGLKTELVAPDDGNVQDSSIPLYTNQEDEPKPSLSVSFSSSHRVVSSSYLFDKPRKVHLAESSRSASESAVTLKTEPQPLSALPSCEQAQHSAWWKSEPPAPGQCSWEQAGDVHREPKLLGNAEVHSKPIQALTMAVAVSPVKNKFSVSSKVSSVQRAASVTVSNKASKFRKTNYTWVANPSKCSRTVKRWISPRASDSAKKTIGGAERGSKISPKADLGAKVKKLGLQSKAGVSPSKYKWKASSLQTSPSTSKSAFRWRSEDQKRPSASNLLPPSSVSVGVNPSLSEAVLTSYKVKSRTKIIKRKGNSGSPADKKSSSSPTTPLKSPFHPRKKNTLRGKPVAPKRSSPKGLVQITKHRLCRLPAARAQGSSREGANLHFIRSPPANKIIKTRYRIVKKNVVTPSSSFNSSGPSWKMKRLLASRSPQASSTPKSSKSQAIQQRWRSKGYRCIGGVMYRVSANKLSKTSSTPSRYRDLSTKSPGRAARLSCTPSSPGFSPFGCLNRSATSRYIASRAVQRSLAIIRQAKQKKEKKKEYCMYYNRFGKCNRGENCPYIHDPEKVAVCTRFLRGTCKKTDGKCPFSHKVSKDKMPVCSYFLKGICNNSNCPYSHVYVSRKAEVCQDFLKGYCPMGEKCKKKHTLVCPDFAKKGICPRGACCKLLHPKKKRQLLENNAGDDGDHGDPPSKWRRLWEETSRNDPAQLSNDGEVPGPSSAEQDVKFWKDVDTPQSSCLQKLPSFISLQSSTSPGDIECKVERDEDEPMEEPGGIKWKRTSMWVTLRDSESTTLEEGSSRGKQLQIKPRL